MLHTGDLDGRNTAIKLAVLDIIDITYGSKRLAPVDLLLRAICWVLFDKDTLGPYPALILPPMLQIDGIDRFHIEALTEPARTGFERYRGANFPTTQAPEPLAKA